MNNQDQLPLVSIVILCWNRKDDIQETLKQISQNDYPNLETIVVDNGSTDGSPDIIEKNYPEVNLIRMKENKGIASYNSGFLAAQGKYTVILDDDSYPGKKAINQAVAEFRKDGKLGIAAFNIFDRNTGKPVYRSHRPKTDQSMETFSFTGCGTMVRTDLFREVDMYPGEYFLYQNEIQPSVRILNRGYKIKYFPQISAYHKFSSKNRANQRDIFYGTRNNLLFIWAHLPFFKALTTSWGVCFIYGFRAVKSGLFKEFLKAKISFLKMARNNRQNGEILKPVVIKMLKPYFKENSVIDFIKRHAVRK